MKMKKVYLASIVCLIWVFLAGCGKRDVDQEDIPQSGLESGESAIGESTGEAGAQEIFNSDNTDNRNNADGGDNADSQDSTDTLAELIVPDTVKKTLKGSLGPVGCLDSGILLFTREKMILMDGITLEAQRETENSAPSFIDQQTISVGDGCMVLGETFEAWSFNLGEYDGELQVKQITDIEEASAAEREIMSCRLLSDGNRILYNNINGFYLFDFTSGETTDLTQEDIFICNFSCLEAKGEILFSGQDEASGKRILGRMDMDGKGMQIEDREHLWGELWGFEDFALADEAELVGKEKEGAVFRYDEQGIHSFPLTDSDENGNITVSCGGGYYGTRTNVQDTALRCYVRIYSSKDGSLVKELPLSYEEYGENFRLGGYLICDDMQRVVLYGTWRGRETESWIVSVNL